MSIGELQFNLKYFDWRSFQLQRKILEDAIVECAECLDLDLSNAKLKALHDTSMLLTQICAQNMHRGEDIPNLDDLVLDELANL